MAATGDGNNPFQRDLGGPIPSDVLKIGTEDERQLVRATFADIFNDDQLKYLFAIEERDILQDAYIFLLSQKASIKLLKRIADRLKALVDLLRRCHEKLKTANATDAEKLRKRIRALRNQIELMMSAAAIVGKQVKDTNDGEGGPGNQTATNLIAEVESTIAAAGLAAGSSTGSSTGSFAASSSVPIGAPQSPTPVVVSQRPVAAELPVSVAGKQESPMKRAAKQAKKALAAAARKIGLGASSTSNSSFTQLTDNA